MKITEKPVRLTDRCNHYLIFSGTLNDRMGNFAAGVMFTKMENFEMEIEHRCNQHRYKQTKVVQFGNFTLEKDPTMQHPKKYLPNEEWMSQQIVIRLEQGIKDRDVIPFSSLEGKEDLEV